MQESKKISEFNEAGLQIQRLHNSWLDIARFRERGDFYAARWKLDTIEAELNNDIVRQEFVDEMKELNESIFNEVSKLEVYKLLLKKEKLLRRVQDKAGKGGKYKDPDEDGY